MRTLLNPVFIICVIVFLANQLLEHMHIYIWPFYAHLDDLLCLPISLTIILAAERAYFQNPYFVLPKRYIIVAVLVFSFMFEVLLPLIGAKYTSDVWDVLAYAVGASIFRVINRTMLPAKNVA